MFLNYDLRLLLAVLFISCAGILPAQNDITFGFVLDDSDPQSVTAVAYPDFTTTNADIPTAKFSFTLPAGTATTPSVPPLSSGTGNFANILGQWTVERLTPADYGSVGSNDPNDLMGNDVYSVTLNPSSIGNNLTLNSGQAVALFSFRLPDDCIGGDLTMLVNDGAIAMSIDDNLFLNYNNQISVAIDDGTPMDLYAGNDVETGSYSCPLDSSPLAIDDPVTIDEDSGPTNIGVTDNDDFGTNAPAVGMIRIITASAKGNATVNDGGTADDPTDDSIDYTPDANENGMDTVAYEICDFDGDCDTALVVITINAVNDEPVANDDTYSTDEDIPLMDDVTVNDTDLDGPGVSVTLVADVANGQLMLNGDGTFTYTPDGDYHGPDGFSYSYCDTGSPELCDTVSVAITVDPVNDPPVITDDGTPVDTIYVTLEEDAVDTTCVTVIDVDDPSVSCTITQPTNGSAVQLNDTCIIYTPDLNYFGGDELMKIADDGNGGMDTVVVIYEVTSVNDKPVAMDDAFIFEEEMEETGDVSTNDTDVDGPQANYTLLDSTANGELTFNPDGSFTYTPNAEYNGADTFTYILCDGGTPELCDTAGVSIDVRAVFVRLDAKVLLGGALIGTGGATMRDDLRSRGLIPLSEPYSAFGSYEHQSGGETIADSAAVLGVTGNDAIVDWVLVQLRDANDSTNVVASRAGLVQRDGDIVDVDGTSVLIFDGTEEGDFYVSVRHQNHLGVMTSTAMTLSAQGTTVDFIDAATPVYHRIALLAGNERQPIDASTTALYPADVSQDGRTIFNGQDNDAAIIKNAVLFAPGNPFNSEGFVLTGYLETDVNMDGDAIFSGQDNDVDFLFDTVNQHPVNDGGNANFVILEQLPVSN